MNTAKELAESSLFKGLEEDALAAFAGIAREVRFGPKVQTWREAAYAHPVIKAVTDESRQATLDWMGSGGG